MLLSVNFFGDTYQLANYLSIISPAFVPESLLISFFQIYGSFIVSNRNQNEICFIQDFFLVNTCAARGGLEFLDDSRRAFIEVLPLVIEKVGRIT